MGFCQWLRHFSDRINVLKLLKLKLIVLEPFYIDHKRLNLSTKTKLLQLKFKNFSLLLIDERGGDKLKLKRWHKSEYRTVLTWMIVICNREKPISNKINCDRS